MGRKFPGGSFPDNFKANKLNCLVCNSLIRHTYCILYMIQCNRLTDRTTEILFLSITLFIPLHQNIFIDLLSMLEIQ